MPCATVAIPDTLFMSSKTRLDGEASSSPSTLIRVVYVVLQATYAVILSRAKIKCHKNNLLVGKQAHARITCHAAFPSDGCPCSMVCRARLDQMGLFSAKSF